MNNIELINTLAWALASMQGTKVRPLLNRAPTILKKKINKDANIIPLKTPNSLGQTRHFPQATKEWSSSVYAYYSNNDIKSIPVKDKNLVKLIKSFLNFYHQSGEILKSKPIHIRFRRLSLKKIFVNKAELKHTNSKVIINIHVYNIQKRLLLEEFKKMKEFVLYPKKKHQLSFPKTLNLVKSAVYNFSPQIYVILIQSIEKEKLLIIKNLAGGTWAQGPLLSVRAPYFQLGPLGPLPARQRQRASMQEGTSFLTLLQQPSQGHPCFQAGLGAPNQLEFASLKGPAPLLGASGQVEQVEQVEQAEQTSSGLNKEDIPYFYYLMKQRLYKAYQCKEIEKEKYLICKFNLSNKSINEWNYPSIFSLIEDLEKEKLIIDNIIRPLLGKGTTGLLPQAFKLSHLGSKLSQSKLSLSQLSQSQSKSNSKRDLAASSFFNQKERQGTVCHKKLYHAIPLYDSIIKEIRVKSRNTSYPYLCCLTFKSETRSLTFKSECTLYKKILVKCLKNELELIRYYKFLLDLYDHKFKCLIPKLKELFSKIYKKKIEFNIVSLKHMYLNSDILTQAIVLKLKARKKRSVWGVLKSCLYMVKLPKTDRLKEISADIKYTSESLVDRIQKLDLDCLTVKLASPPLLWQRLTSKGPARLEKSLASLASSEARSFFIGKDILPLRSKASLWGQDNDSLNLLLFGIMSLRPCIVYKGITRFAPYSDGWAAYNGAGLCPSKAEAGGLTSWAEAEDNSRKDSFMLKPNIVIGMPPNEVRATSILAINNFFFKSCLKHKAIGGVRLEAKGRLTRRFTAARSVFKLQWKGSLKNIDSSCKGLSAVILRGHVKSNVQYSVKYTRNRIGSYGVKGWVSGK